MSFGKFIQKLKSLRMRNRSFLVIGLIALIFALSFGYPILFPVGLTLLILLGAFFLTDLILLYGNGSYIVAHRDLQKMLGLGDENPVQLTISSTYPISLKARVFDELPIHFQEREFEISLSMAPASVEKLRYEVRPIKRGNYAWGRINVIVSSSLGFLERAFVSGSEQQVDCLPSILQMKHFELRAFARVANYQGIKRMRRLGHSYEF